MRLAALLLVGICGLACSTGDTDPEPADAGGRIQRTTAHVDSQLNQAREALDGNLCRCGSHVRVVRAVMAAAGQGG